MYEDGSDSYAYFLFPNATLAHRQKKKDTAEARATLKRQKTKDKAEARASLECQQTKDIARASLEQVVSSATQARAPLKQALQTLKSIVGLEKECESIENILTSIEEKEAPFDSEDEGGMPAAFAQPGRRQSSSERRRADQRPPPRLPVGISGQKSGHCAPAAFLCSYNGVDASYRVGADECLLLRHSAGVGARGFLDGSEQQTILEYLHIGLVRASELWDADSATLSLVANFSKPRGFEYDAVTYAVLFMDRRHVEPVKTHCNGASYGLLSLADAKAFLDEHGVTTPQWPLI